MLKRLKNSFPFAKSDRSEEKRNSRSNRSSSGCRYPLAENPLMPEIDGRGEDLAAIAPYPSQYPTASTSKKLYSSIRPQTQPPERSLSDGGDGVLPVSVTPHCPKCIDPVESQETVTIRNEVKIKEETLRVEPDQGDPGKFITTFTFDATAPCSITIMFFAKESRCGDQLIATEEFSLKQITVHFREGLNQMFRQSSGSGIDLSCYEETELAKESCVEVYPLAVKAQTFCLDHQEPDGTPTRNCEIILSSLNRCEKDEYKVQVIKQIFWVDGIRFELQERYGIGNPRKVYLDVGDSERKCAVSLSEPLDTTIPPCQTHGMQGL